MVSKRTKYPPKPNYPPNNNGSDVPIPGRCGAKLKGKNKYCKNYPTTGQKRCKFHGGILGNLHPPYDARSATRPIKHGIYATNLSKDDEKVYFETELGTVDEEIRMAKVQVFRAYRAQNAYEQAIQLGHIDSDGMVLMEITITYGEIKETKIVKRRDDFRNEIIRSSNMVAKLEGVRSELIKHANPFDNPDSPLNKLVSALTSIRNGGGIAIEMEKNDFQHVS